MDIQNVFNQMCDQISKFSNNAETMLKNSGSENDPTTLLHIQYVMQQYSVLIGTASSVMKSLKDMMSGITAKIG